MKENSYMEDAVIFKGLADGKRLKIMEMLCRDELCASKILGSFNIKQSTLSHHMKILCVCGLVDFRQEGKWIKYSIDKEKLDYIKARLNIIMESKDQT